METVPDPGSIPSFDTYSTRGRVDCPNAGAAMAGASRDNMDATAMIVLGRVSMEPSPRLMFLTGRAFQAVPSRSIDLRQRPRRQAPHDPGGYSSWVRLRGVVRGGRGGWFGCGR